MAIICNHNVYNFTPHDCTFVEPDGFQTPIPAEGIAVRLTETREIGQDIVKYENCTKNNRKFNFIWTLSGDNTYVTKN